VTPGKEDSTGVRITMARAMRGRTTVSAGLVADSEGAGLFGQTAINVPAPFPDGDAQPQPIFPNAAQDGDAQPQSTQPQSTVRNAQPDLAGPITRSRSKLDAVVVPAGTAAVQAIDDPPAPQTLAKDEGAGPVTRARAKQEAPAAAEAAGSGWNSSVTIGVGQPDGDARKRGADHLAGATLSQVVGLPFNVVPNGLTGHIMRVGGESRKPEFSITDPDGKEHKLVIKSRGGIFHRPQVCPPPADPWNTLVQQRCCSPGL
jgi:hypothetical protein